MTIKNFNLKTNSISMSSFYKFIILTVCSIASNGLLAQSQLSKETAISQMLENNFGIQLVNNQIEIAENNKNVLNSGYLPSVSAEAGAQYEEADDLRAFPGVVDDEGLPRPDANILGAESQRYNAALNVNYLLFDGLGRYYNYQQLKEEYNLSELEARETIENTILQLFTVYFDVARLSENLEVLKRALEISRNRITRAQYQFEYGQNTKLAVLQAEVDVVTDSVNVLNTRQELINAKRDLNVVLNRELETTFEVDTLVAFQNRINLESYVKKANENNVTLLQAETQVQISDYGIKASRSLLLPTIGLTGSYGWSRVNSPTTVFFPGSISRGRSFILGANLTWNIFDGGSSITSLKNSKILKESDEIQREQLKLQVKRDIANAKGNYDNLLTIYAIREQNVETNKNNLARSQERLNLGQITSIEFRQAQINLINAETSKNLAKYDAKLAELQLLQLTGQLLNVEY